MELKKLNKKSLLSLCQKLKLDVKNDILKEDLIFDIEVFIEENKISQEKILSYIKNEEEETDDFLQEKINLDLEVIKEVLEEKVEPKLILNPSLLTHKEREWLKFLKERNLTPSQFLKSRPLFKQNDIIKRLELLGY